MKEGSTGLLLKSVSLSEIPQQAAARYPFTVPVVRSLSSFTFEKPVTIFVGENGTGKSTLMEAIAAAAGSFAIGGESVERDKTLAPARELARSLRLSWSRKTRKGFFLRTEDFFNFARKMKQDQLDLKEMAEDFGRTLSGYGRQLAVGATLGQKHALESRYGEDLDANSHGESFLKLFQSRLQGEGLYVLDEPEAPLSPIRQIALIAMIRDCIQTGSQFLIATHSPILMGFPGADLVTIQNGGLQRSAFEELEHVNVTRSFLNNPESYLRHL